MKHSIEIDAIQNILHLKAYRTLTDKVTGQQDIVTHMADDNFSQVFKIQKRL